MRTVNELDREQIDRFLDEQVMGRLGCHDAEGIYVVPLIYARDGQVLYVLTTEGRKIRAARRNPAVCFEVDEYDRKTGSWRSVIVWGRYEELEGGAKTEALAALARRHGTRRASSETPAPEERAAVAFRIVIESATGRAVTRPASFS
jgi:uncharacterized protein